MSSAWPVCHTSPSTLPTIKISALLLQEEAAGRDVQAALHRSIAGIVCSSENADFQEQALHLANSSLEELPITIQARAPFPQSRPKYDLSSHPAGLHSLCTAGFCAIRAFLGMQACLENIALDVVAASANNSQAAVLQESDSDVQV